MARDDVEAETRARTDENVLHARRMVFSVIRRVIICRQVLCKAVALPRETRVLTFNMSQRYRRADYCMVMNQYHDGILLWLLIMRRALA